MMAVFERHTAALQARRETASASDEVTTIGKILRISSRLAASKAAG